MIARWVLHVEAHRGYWPRVSVRRAPRHGQRAVNGGEPGVLAACPTCSGVGFLHVPDAGRGQALFETVKPSVKPSCPRCTTLTCCSFDASTCEHEHGERRPLRLPTYPRPTRETKP